MDLSKVERCRVIRGQKHNGVEIVTPCDCVDKMRKFKNDALYRLYNLVEGSERSLGGPLGIFGAEMPDDDVIVDAVDGVKDAVKDYVNLCPSKMGPQVFKLASKMHKDAMKGMNVGDLFSGRFQQSWYEFAEATEAFVGNIIDGLHETTTGLRATKGPFSDDQWTRHKCTSLLNNMEASRIELDENLEFLDGYMSPPVPQSLAEINELAQLQSEITGEYQSYCSQEKLNKVSEIEQLADVRWNKIEEVKDLEDKYAVHSVMGQRWRYDYPEEERTAGFDKIEKQSWAVLDDMKKQQELVEKLVDEEWDRHCKPLKFKGVKLDHWVKQDFGQFHPEPFSNWYARFNRQKNQLRPEAHKLLMQDRIFSDMISALEYQLDYGRKMKDKEAFKRYFLEEDVDKLGKWDTWTVPKSDRYIQFNKDYLEEAVGFWSDPDNIARSKILLSKIEDQVKGRTRYGIRSGMATEPGHVLAWSNGCWCWIVTRRPNQPGEELYLNANYIFIPGDYETLNRIRWLIPDLPLVHMDWTTTMDLSLKEEKERERYR